MIEKSSYIHPEPRNFTLYLFKHREYSHFVIAFAPVANPDQAVSVRNRIMPQRRMRLN